jgi:type VI secretion system secreted protein VgrG
LKLRQGNICLWGGANAQAEIPLIPTLGQYNIQFELRDKETQDLMPFTSYMLMNDQGHVSYGKTDANGLTQAFVTDKQENYYLHAINDKIKKLDN